MINEAVSTPAQSSYRKPTADFKRTNVRLPPEIHTMLKRAAIDRGMSIEEIVLAAVEKELGFGNPTATARTNSELRQLGQSIRNIKAAVQGVEKYLDQFLRPTPLEFAKRFAEACPLPINIKRASDEVIVWCNKAYSEVFGCNRADLIGRTLADIEGDVDARLTKMPLKEEIFDELLSIKGRKLRFSTHQFSFSVGDEAYIGDLSFDQNDIEIAKKDKARYFDPFAPDTILEMSDFFQNALLAAFLESIRTVALVKRTDGRILWCNRPFLALAHKHSPEEVLNQTTPEILGLGPLHPSAQFDEEVATKGCRVLGMHTIEGNDRIVAHFPIFGFGGVEFLGLLSCNMPDIWRSRQKR